MSGANPSGKVDLTAGPIIRRVLLFALPLCLGNVLQQMYTTVDTLIIGRFCGTVSLAAVGTSAQPVEILLCIFIGLGGGVSILVAQYTGSGDQQRLCLTTGNAVSLTWFISLPLTALAIVLGPMILRVMRVPEDTMPAAVDYIRITFLGTLPTLGYNTNAGILRGLGNSRSTLYFLMISCGVNIALDLLMVGVLGMDVTGAALATVIAQWCSWIISVRYLQKRYPELSVPTLPGRMERQTVVRILRIGLPLGLNHSLYSMGHMVMQLLINTQGSAFIAACSVASKVNGLANMAVTSLSSSATTFAGQNLGAGRYGRLKQGIWRIPVMSGALCMAAGLMVTVFCRPILGLFTREAAVLDLACLYVRVVLPFYWAYAVFNGLLSFVNGMNLVRYTTVVNMVMLWVVRIPVACLILHFFDGTYVMAAISISFVFGMLAMCGYFLTGHWRMICARAREEAKTT